MTQGRIVNQQQAEELEGVFIDSDTFFHFVQDINDNYFLILSEQDEIEISQTQYSYLLSLPLEDYQPKPNPPIP
jgi:hypothetical protein